MRHLHIQLKTHAHAPNPNAIQLDIEISPHTPPRLNRLPVTTSYCMCVYNIHHTTYGARTQHIGSVMPVVVCGTHSRAHAHIFTICAALGKCRHSQVPPPNRRLVASPMKGALTPQLLPNHPPPAESASPSASQCVCAVPATVTNASVVSLTDTFADCASPNGTRAALSPISTQHVVSDARRSCSYSAAVVA